MSDLERKSKKELVGIIDQLKEKLLGMKEVETKTQALESKLDGYGMSVIQDTNGKFKLVEISFDIETKTAKIDSVKEFITQSYEYALYDAKRVLVEKVFNKKNLNHLKEKKNG